MRIAFGDGLFFRGLVPKYWGGPGPPWPPPRDPPVLAWTHGCKSCLQLVANFASPQTATKANISGPIHETFFCSGSLKLGSFGYLWQAALALIGPI